MKFFGFKKENGIRSPQKWDEENFIQDKKKMECYCPISDEDFKKSLEELSLLYPILPPGK